MKTLNTTIILIILFFVNTNTYSQSWQWGKRGGSFDQLSALSGFRREEVYSIVTDANQNIYILSAVGINGIDIDGHPKTGYGDPTTLTDYALTSFACDGSFRWSKIIGGESKENILSLQIDAQGYIYVAGTFATCSGADNYPARIENDVVLLQDNNNCSRLFIAKFSGDGVLQWFKRPQVPDASTYNYCGTFGLNVEPNGNIHWFVTLPPGTFSDGAFVNTLAGHNWFVLDYDSNGNFVNATYMDMQFGSGAAFGLKFYRNPNNGQYYFVGNKDSDDSVIIGGQAITHEFYISSFNISGAFLWTRESTSTTSYAMRVYNLCFDANNNIYAGGAMAGLNIESFLGYNNNATFGTHFLMKMNSDASASIWANNNTKGTSDYGAIVLHANEIGFSGYGGGTVNWAGGSVFATSPNQGNRTLFGRFDQTTGACLGLTVIPSDTPAYNNGCAIAVDAAGDYILGGGFSSQQFFGTGSNVCVGGQSDFFVAKYSTSLCSPLGVGEVLFSKKESILVVAPNPAKNQTTIFYNYVSNQPNKTIVVLDVLGRTLNSFTPKENKGNFVLNTNSFADGTYFVLMKENGKVVEKMKLIIKN